jgi:hypothetical protein
LTFTSGGDAFDARGRLEARVRQLEVAVDADHDLLLAVGRAAVDAVVLGRLVDLFGRPLPVERDFAADVGEDLGASAIADLDAPIEAAFSTHVLLLRSKKSPAGGGAGGSFVVCGQAGSALTRKVLMPA